MSRINFKLATCIIFLTAALVSGCSNGQSAPVTNSSAAKIDAKNLKNPVPPSTKSIDSGKKLYSRLCADCHGTAGDGISETANVLIQSGKIAPSNLTDDVWDLGSTDGEIFMVIRDGSGSNLAMKGLNGRPGIVDEDVWNLVNYIHTLHK
jgi:cytochrome c